MHGYDVDVWIGISTYKNIFARSKSSSSSWTPLGASDHVSQSLYKHVVASEAENPRAFAQDTGSIVNGDLARRISINEVLIMGRL